MDILCDEHSALFAFEPLRPEKLCNKCGGDLKHTHDIAVRDTFRFVKSQRDRADGFAGEFDRDGGDNARCADIKKGEGGFVFDGKKQRRRAFHYTNENAFSGTSLKAAKCDRFHSNGGDHIDLAGLGVTQTDKAEVR